jgi:hypothetical protein
MLQHIPSKVTAYTRSTPEMVKRLFGEIGLEPYKKEGFTHWKSFRDNEHIYVHARGKLSTDKGAEPSDRTTILLEDIDHEEMCEVGMKFLNDIIEGVEGARVLDNDHKQIYIRPVFASYSPPSEYL